MEPWRPLVARKADWVLIPAPASTTAKNIHRTGRMLNSLEGSSGELAPRLGCARNRINPRNPSAATNRHRVSSQLLSQSIYLFLTCSRKISFRVTGNRSTDVSGRDL